MDDDSGFRQHAKWCPQGPPPPGVRRLDLFPDYCAFPVWGRGMTTPDALGISSELADELQTWQDLWEEQASSRAPEPEVPRIGVGTPWDEQGRVLAIRLESETGAAVVYQWPVGPDGGDPSCPRCGRYTREALAGLDEWLARVQGRTTDSAE